MLVNKLLKVLYLFLLICGIHMLLVGLFFNKFQWPDMFNGIYVGSVFLTLGVVILIITIRRKSKLYNTKPGV